MIIGQSGDIYPIHNDNRYNQYDFSYDDILAFVITQGFTSFLLIPYYSNGGYWIQMCNPTLDNGGLYLLDYKPNADVDQGGFYSVESTPYKNRWVVATGSSSLSVYNSMSITLGNTSYQNRTYYYSQNNISSMSNLEYVFGTSLNYSKVYVNNIDITPVSYNWQSIPSITGKNGKVWRLTDILTINDGNAVNDVVSKGNLDFSKKTKVNTLIDNVIPVVDNPTKAVINYSMPLANYEYVKLVYKKGSIPTSAEDGTAKTIDPDDSSVGVTGLEKQTVYYFAIFTNKTVSDAVYFKTGGEDINGIFKIKITNMQGAKDGNFKENIEVTRV